MTSGPAVRAVRAVRAVPAGRIPAPRAAAPDGHVLALLAAGIPLTLLMDLASPGGPDSRLILAEEQRQARRARARSPQVVPA